MVQLMDRDPKPKPQAIVFIHGLGGSRKTWGAFGDLIKADSDLSGLYDVVYYNYPTYFFPLPFVKKGPKVQILADGLVTFLHSTCSIYDQVHLVSHSLGGLVARQCVLKKLKEASPRKPSLGTITFFAVPCNGAGLASVASYTSPFNLQARQVCRSSDFIDNLNEAWVAGKLDGQLKVKYVVGGLDNVITSESARSHYGNERVETIVDKGHINIVKPTNAQEQSFLIVKQMLLANKPDALGVDAARAIGELLETANRLYAAGQFDDAEVTLEKAVKLGRPSGVVIRELGKVYFARRSFDKIGKLVENWENAGYASDADVLCMKGELLIRKGELEPAIETLSSISPRTIYNLEYLTGSAYLLLALEKPLNLVFALKHLKSAVAIDPSSWWARTNLIYVLVLLEKAHSPTHTLDKSILGEHRTIAWRTIEIELAAHPLMFSIRLYRLALAVVFDDRPLFEQLVAEDIAFFTGRELAVTYIFPSSWIARLKLLYRNDAEALDYFEKGLYRWLASI